MNTNVQQNQEIEFEKIIKSLEAQFANAGAHLTIDSAARQLYAREIKRMADTLRSQANKGSISWEKAAVRAQESRNLVMEIVRNRSTPVGRAIAQKIKATGYTLNDLIARQTIRLHGERAIFSKLSPAKQNAIYAEIISSAGRSNAKVTRAMSRMAYAGRGLIVVALGLSVYNIATATNRSAAIKQEVAANSAGIAGGMAGGALAGLACGPGAPVCVTVGAFAGGALAAFGSTFIW
ncbi:hypothetical protein [Pseudoduganella lutea]|uniref:Uncharacterized protein n=1 Tax=Pseudoduganella lutea TaxID=321985 RepID=A0A4P6KUS8_9BURK|nr:hypothetical protein [Pseudoduganella lutea]QBE62405.1 hypothetical protein EWM63_04950 [Pseudoduganella lutea]